MRTSTLDPRSWWVGCLLVAAALAPSCGNQSPAPESLELDAVSEALSPDQYECEREKRECLVAADCVAEAREACESTFRSCTEPLRAEKKRVSEQCRSERDTCEAAATDDAGRHACHIAEHKCKLPVEPPEAVCHIDALECDWAARMSSDPPESDADKAAKKACHDEEHECKESLRMKPEDLPKPPHCPHDPPPPACDPSAPAEPVEPEAPEAPLPIPGEPDCELEKRECLIAADCEPDARKACESAFRACEEPARAEKKRVREECRASRETCEEAATDEAGRHACHIAEHECKLPVEPPEAVCRIEAEKCIWAARPESDPMTPAEPTMPPPEPSAEEKACHEQERACREEKRVPRDDLPKPPRCAPSPPACMPAMPAA